MALVFKTLVITDLTHHASVESVTGKVKFQIGESSETRQGLDQFVIVDAVVPAGPDESLREVRGKLLDRAVAVLQAVVGAAADGGLEAQAGLKEPPQVN